MAPKKQKAIKPAVEVSAKRLPAKTHDGRPTRAEKKIINKATNKASKELVKEIREVGKAVGAIAVARPYAPAHERFWRKPDVAWTEELGEDMFLLMSTGHSMDAVSKFEGMPSVYQMMRWLANETHPFVAIRARAQKYLIPFYEELAKDITLTSNPQSIITKKQVLTRDGDIEDIVEERIIDNVERSKLAFLGLQWTLGHLMPKKHGRSPDQGTGQANEQLKGLIDALKAGPADV